MKLILALFFLNLAVFAFCAEPVKIILDTDMASDCDDVGALAVLHVLADRGEAEILAVVNNSKDYSNASAGAVDAINTWYGRPDIPLGTDKDGARGKPNNASSFTIHLKQEFPNDADVDDRMPDALAIYRKILASQPDSSVVICSVGALSNLEDLIRSKPDEYSGLDGLGLIRKKVKKTVIMGGGFPRTSSSETNIRLDPAAAVTVVNEWPGEVIWQGFEVGAALIIGSELKQTDAKNPVRRAYELRPFRGQKAIDQGKPAHDLAAVLIAVRGYDSPNWSISAPGSVVVDSEGHTIWKPFEDGKHRYVSIKAHPVNIEKIIGNLLQISPK